MSSAQQLFAVTPEGPQRLAVPAGLADPGEVFDPLPLGIYEALRTFDHVRFVGLREHLDRAERSMELFGLEGPMGRETLQAALHSVVSNFPAADVKVRFDVLCGPATQLGTTARTLLQATELSLPPREVYERGVCSQLTSALRRERPGIKTTQWVVERRLAQGGSPANYEPILRSEEGFLLEGIMSNLFAVRDGVLLTAPMSGVLPGVTRGILIELARELEIPVLEEAVHEDDLGTLQEAFLSTSVRSVVPLVKIAGVSLGDGRPGPQTKRLMHAYGEYCARVARPALPS
ncbi:MAG: aminotransferase class IV [Planctomycetota bacterium]